MSEWDYLCKKCYSATKKNNWTKKDSRELLKQTRKFKNVIKLAEEV